MNSKPKEIQQVRKPSNSFQHLSCTGPERMGGSLAAFNLNRLNLNAIPDFHFYGIQWFCAYCYQYVAGDFYA